jgi:hypothetical protein
MVGIESINVVAGPKAANWIVAPEHWVNPTTVVSTKLNNGSLNHMKNVVAQNNNKRCTMVLYNHPYPFLQQVMKRY